MLLTFSKANPAGGDWKLPFYFALLLHFSLVVGVLYLPNLFKAKPKFADIYTVSLVNVADPEPPAPPAPPAKSAKPTPKKAAPPPKAAPEKLQEVVNKKAVAIEEAVPAKEVEAAPPKAVSLKPLKQKVVKKVEKPQVDLEAKQRELEQKRLEEKRQQLAEQKRLEEKRQQLAEQRRRELASAIRQEQLLAEQARLAREALEQERNLLQNAPPSPASVRPSTSQPSTTGTGTGHGMGSSNSLIDSQYYASVINRLQQFWALPEYLQNNSSLLAIVVITINSDGQIQHHFFEERSGDRIFDQFVSKTIESANPLPPIPPAMRKQRIEVGLRFSPGSIQ